MTFDRNSQSMEFIKPNIVYSPGLSVGQDDGFAHKVRLGLVEFGEDGACTRFGDWHGVARIGCRECGVAYESVQLVAKARQQDAHGTSRRNLSCLHYRSPKPIVGKHTRHRREVADVAVDHPKQVDDRGLVS